MTASDEMPEKPSLYSLVLNFLPVVFLLIGVWVVSLVTNTLMGAVAVGTAWLFIIPPFIGRLLIVTFGRPRGLLKQRDNAYRVWWALTQLQMPFNRIPLLEELLRLVPGVYSLWIWMWGGHLSSLAYVAPGVIITDRFAIVVERGAVLGMRSAYAGHMALRDKSGAWCVLVETPHVGAHALVGGDAGLGPGAHLLSGASLPYGRQLGPNAIWPRTAS
jgi:hypothetical protein